MGCGCWRNVLIPLVCLLVWLGCGCFLAFAWLPVGFLHALLLVPFLPSCWFSLPLRGLGLVPLFAFVPVLFLVSSRSCWRFFPSVVPFWFRFLFRCRPFGLSGGGVPPVVLAISFCWALPCGGGGVRGGVVVCFLPLSFFLPKGGGWGWLGWLFYYQIQKFPVVSFTV